MDSVMCAPESWACSYQLSTAWKVAREAAQSVTRIHARCAAWYLSTLGNACSLHTAERHGLPRCQPQRQQVLRERWSRLGPQPCTDWNYAPGTPRRNVTCFPSPFVQWTSGVQAGHRHRRQHASLVTESNKDAKPAKQHGAASCDGSCTHLLGYTVYSSTFVGGGGRRLFQRTRRSAGQTHQHTHE